MNGSWGGDHEVSVRLARIERYLRVLMRAARKEVERDEMAQADIDALKAEVARTKGVVASVKVLIAGLMQQIIDAGDDPAEIQAAVAELKAATDELAAQVPANP